MGNDQSRMKGKIGHIVKFPLATSLSGLPDPDKTGAWGGCDILRKELYILSEIRTQPSHYVEESGLLYMMTDYYGRIIIGMIYYK